MSLCCTEPLVTTDQVVQTGDDCARPSPADWVRVGFAGLVAAQAMVFGLAANLTPPQGLARTVIHGVLALAALIVMVLLAPPLWQEAWRQVREKRLGFEQLFLVSMLGALAASVHSSLTGVGGIYYEVVAVLLGIYTFGQILGRRRREQALQAAAILDREFAWAWKITGTERDRIPARNIRPGDQLAVAAGENISVDGVVRKGVAFVRETALTGEPFPVVKRAGDLVQAGGVALDQALEIEATARGDERTLDRLLGGLASARNQGTRWQREADRIVSWFLPVLTLVAGATFVGWTLARNWEIGLSNALAVLLVACPCAMGLATPIAIWGSLNALARRGLVARSSDFIERLSVVDTVIFDKTGTLSEDQLRVADFVCAHPESRSQLQSWVSAIEAQCHHPVAAAFAVWPRAAVAVENFQLSPGEGVSASLLGHRIEVGRTAGEGAENLRAQVKTKGLEIFIRVDGKIEGLAILREKARDGVPQVWAALKALDLRVGIMTGDRTENAAQLGLENIESGLTPEEKTVRVRALQAEGRRILFVGDGVNDAGALIEATAGVALTSGSALARETAKAELFGSNLASLPYAIALARQVRLGLRRNLWIAAFYNLGGVALAATGLLHPVIAALLMLAASATVTWRALSLAEKLQVQAENPELIGDESRLKRRWSSSFLYQRENSVALLLGVGVGLQGLLLVYLGQLEPRTTVVLGLTSVLLACLVTAFWRRWNEAPIWQMAVAMFSIGNVAMLLGWWADAGFGAIVRDGLCLCGCAKSDLGLGLIARFNWMQAGMLVSAFPMTWVLPRQAYPLSRWRHALWMAAGMLAGMWLAGAVMTQFSIWDPHRHFLLTYLAMTIGMLTGMMAVCRYVRGVVTP